MSTLKKKPLKLNNSNYYSDEANQEYISVSQYKDFFGTLGYKGCEAQALAKIRGEYKEEPSTALLVGCYVDSYFEGTLEQFKEEHPEILKKDGTLKAEYIKADAMIAAAEESFCFLSDLKSQLGTPSSGRFCLM